MALKCRCDDIYFAIIPFISHNFRIFIVALISSWYVTTNYVLMYFVVDACLRLLGLIPFFSTDPLIG